MPNDLGLRVVDAAEKPAQLAEAMEVICSAGSLTILVGCFLYIAAASDPAGFIQQHLLVLVGHYRWCL